MKTRTSREYAEAIFQLAEERSRQDETAEAMTLLSDVISRTPGLVRTLSSPAIPRKTRYEQADRMFSAHLPDFLSAVLRMLISRNHMDLLEEIISEYRELLRISRGIEKASVVTAFPMDETQKHRLKEKLEECFGKKLELHTVTDPSLLGGIRVTVNGRVYDGSLRNRLKQFKEVISS